MAKLFLWFIALVMLLTACFIVTLFAVTDEVDDQAEARLQRHVYSVAGTQVEHELFWLRTRPIYKLRFYQHDGPVSLLAWCELGEYPVARCRLAWVAGAVNWNVEKYFVWSIAP